MSELGSHEETTPDAAISVAASRWASTPQRKRRLAQGRGGNTRACRRCGTDIIGRRRLPIVFRPLRWIGIRVRAYKCMSCTHRFLVFGGHPWDDEP